jgi:hypothetical protein
MQITTMNYQKHLHTFMMLLATLLGVSVSALRFIYTKTVEWYQDGGKEELIQLSYQSREILIDCYTWIMQEFVPGMVAMYQGIRYIMVLLGVSVPIKVVSQTA